MYTRRNFIKSAGLYSSLQFIPSIHPANLITERIPLLKTSCNLYSFNKLLTEGTMTLEEVLLFCADLGFQAVDPTGYYLPGYPDTPADEYIYALKNLAFSNGLDISGTGIRTNFALADPALRKEQIEFTTRWIEVAAKLGAPALRVFAGHLEPDGPRTTEVLPWIIESLQQCAEVGAEYGVMITLQNHFDVLKSVQDVRWVLEAIPSPWFGLNLDIGSLRLNDPYEDIRTLLPFARSWQIKENLFRNEIPEPTDIPRLIRIIKEGGYRGYLPLETLPPSDPRTALRPMLKKVADAINK